MKLAMDVSGLKLIFKLDSWHDYSTPDYVDVWTKITMSVTSKDIQYRIFKKEVLEAKDIAKIYEYLVKLLTGELKDDKELTFIEPDFEFALNISRDIRQVNPNVIYAAPEYQVVDINVTWNIRLWQKYRTWSPNRIQLHLYRKEVHALCIYLGFELKLYQISHPSIQELITEGILIDEKSVN